MRSVWLNRHYIPFPSDAKMKVLSYGKEQKRIDALKKTRHFEKALAKIEYNYPGDLTSADRGLADDSGRLPGGGATARCSGSTRSTDDQTYLRLLTMCSGTWTLHFADIALVRWCRALEGAVRRAQVRGHVLITRCGGGATLHLRNTALMGRADRVHAIFAAAYWRREKKIPLTIISWPPYSWRRACARRV